MRILANENFPEEAVLALRLIITFDKDFGELAFRSRLPVACGIVLFRLAAPSAAYVARAAVAALESRTDWAGNFAVVEERRIRMRPLPMI
jgi:hypothetical protein